MNSLLSFIPALKQKSPIEWAGPCPRCGGDDRFCYWPTESPERGGRFLCRGCYPQSGSGIDLLVELFGMTVKDACAAVGLCRDKAPQRQSFTTSATPNPKPAPAVTMPPAGWQQQAARFLHSCQAGLETNPAAVVALATRALTPSAALACGLGWNPADRYEHREAWGLPPVQGKCKMVLPAGLVIATRRKSGVVALTIRTVDPPRPKYWEVAGSGKNLPYVIGRPGLPVVLLESALDAALLSQEADDLCAAVGFMGSMKGMASGIDAFIRNAPAIIACPDNDSGGQAAWQRWSTIYPTAVCCPAAGAKDLGDMHRAALGLQPVPTVRDWALSALNIARQNTPERRENVVSRKLDTTQAPTLKTAQEAA